MKVFLLLGIVALLTGLGWSQELQSQPLCPVPKGLQGPSLQARVDWFRQRHPQSTVRIVATLHQRVSNYQDRLLGGRCWQGSEPLLKPPDPRLANQFLDHFPAATGECWLEITATEQASPPPALPLYYLHPDLVECYSYRDGGDPGDQLEILETHLHDGLYEFRCWLPAEARWSRPSRPGSLREWPEERWQELSVSPEFQKEAQHPDKVWSQAEGKLAKYPTYALAAEFARSLPRARMLELGSNHWPVMPIGVFPVRPEAEFFTVDCHYSGLWLMEKVLQQKRPEWLPRVHRYLADFSEPLPLPDQFVDVVVSTAAFMTVHFPAPEALATFAEVQRVLKPGGRFYCDGMELESRPAWLTWAVLQRFRVREDWGGGSTRNLCWETRS